MLNFTQLGNDFINGAEAFGAKISRDFSYIWGKATSSALTTSELTKPVLTQSELTKPVLTKPVLTQSELTKPKDATSVLTQSELIKPKNAMFGPKLFPTQVDEQKKHIKSSFGI